MKVTNKIVSFILLFITTMVFTPGNANAGLYQHEYEEIELDPQGFYGSEWCSLRPFSNDGEKGDTFIFSITLLEGEELGVYIIKEGYRVEKGLSHERGDTMLLKYVSDIDKPLTFEYTIPDRYDYFLTVHNGGNVTAWCDVSYGPKPDYEGIPLTIVVILLIFIIAISVVSVYLYKKHKKVKQNKSQQQNGPDETNTPTIKDTLPPPCPYCRAGLQYNERYASWYCSKCNQYSP